jgi:3-hydroxybutyryl-CoA dehydratase
MPKVQVGARASRTKTITDADIRAFAAASGDTNSIHLDEEYAKTTRFGRRIAHGMLTASLISAVLGNDLPGLGTIYLSQTLAFKAPVYLGDTITANVEVTAFRSEKRIATLRTTCTNQEGTLVLEGEAVVIAPEETA